MAEKPPDRTVRAVPRFLKSKRRLTPAVQTEVDNQVKVLLDDPLKGEMKKGTLKGVRVKKFNGENRQYLLAYYFFPKLNVIEMLDVGVHENFYTGLEGYLKDRP